MSICRRRHGSTVKHLAEAELAGAETFANLHGITSENIREFLVELVPVTVLWHGIGPGPREIWLVLHERETDGYLIAFDPSSRMWGLVIGKPEDQFVLVSGLTETCIDTVIGM